MRVAASCAYRGERQRKLRKAKARRITHDKDWIFGRFEIVVSRDQSDRWQQDQGNEDHAADDGDKDGTIFAWVRSRRRLETLQFALEEIATLGGRGLSSSRRRLWRW